MDQITVSAASGLRSRMESIDMLANNLANASTAGYKRDSEMFSLYLSETALNAWADADPVTAALPVIESNFTDFSQGLLQTTGDAMDLAISGPGFFAVRNGGATLYTRNGQFQMTAAGELTTQEGYPVMTTGGEPLRLNPNLPVTVSPEGIVSQGADPLGQLMLVDFANRSQMQKVGRSYYRSEETGTRPERSSVAQGKLEGSNVNTPETSVRLMNVMRQFEMLTKAIQVNAEMNRKAITDVARVGS
jgi:flagellar basal-body rod protein FlgF